MKEANEETLASDLNDLEPKILDTEPELEPDFKIKRKPINQGIQTFLRIKPNLQKNGITKQFNF